MEIVSLTTWLCVHYPVMVGFLGDGATFLGSSLLALDALRPTRQFDEEKKAIAAWNALPIKKSNVETEGRTLATGDDVKVVLMNHRARKAKVGYILLTIGFAALLVRRWIEATS